MSTPTRAQDLRTVVTYGKRTDAQRLAFAAAAHRIVTGGTSQADLVREIKAADPATLISTKTLSLALKAYRTTLAASDGSPDAVTAENYGEAFRAVNTASAESGRDKGERKPTVTDGKAAPATLDDALAAIAALTAWAGSQDDDTRQAVADALFDASESLQPSVVVLVATPVAA